MDAERLKQIEEIYHEALEIPESKREAFFKNYCGEDESLRREVETLLAFEKTFDNFIDTPPESLAAEMFFEQEKAATPMSKEFGHYKIKNLLGRGGMGDVYLAEDTRLNRRVALKFLSAVFSSDKNRLHRFEREAFAASALNHPNILTIYEFGAEKDTYFLATEYVEGETLREILSRPDLPLNEILNIVEQTAFALSAAHKAGIIHRDIKPENIMVREDGIVKVLDFGLAKLIKTEIPSNESLLTSESEAATRVLMKTNPGIVMGTAAYMSPEQTRGLANIDSRTDIWSLGVIIFEMLTGRVPFEGETFSDIIAAILKTDAPPLSKFIPECPAELERIVAKCLKKNPEERYQVIKDLALDLKSLKKSLEFSAEFDRVTDNREKNLTTQIPKQHTTVAEKIKRFPVWNFLFSLLVGAMVFGGAWWYFGGFRNRSEFAETVSSKTTEIVSWSSKPGEIYSVGSFSPDAKTVAFASTRSGTKNIWIKQIAAGEAIQITKDEFGNKNPIWSPNGEELAYFSTKGNQAGIWRIPKLGGSPKWVAAISDVSGYLRFWSKTDQIYYEANGNIFALDANSAQTKQITDLKVKGVKSGSISISHDEKQIVYISVEEKLYSVWTVGITGESPKKLFSSSSEIRNTVWNSDSQRIFFSMPVDGTFQIFVTDIYANQPRQISNSEQDGFALDASSDGTKILYGSAKEESDVWGVNLKEHKEFTVVSEINSELWASVSPDGKTVSYQSIKNLSQGNKLFKGAILTKTINTEQEPVQLISEGGLPIWSPDGKQIAFVRLVGDNHQIEIINAATGGQKTIAVKEISSILYSILPYNKLENSDFSWSPDSTKIAYISRRNGQHNIYSVNADGSNDEQMTNNPDSNLILSCPLWSADGKRIAYTAKTNNSAGKTAFSVLIVDTQTKNSKSVTQKTSFLRLISWMQGDSGLLLASTAGSGIAALPTEVTLLQVQAETGEMRETMKLKETYLYNIHLSPDKKNIAFAAHREGKDNVWLMSIGGGEAKQITGNIDVRLYFSSLAWSPDNSSIFFGKQSRYSLLSMLTNFK